MSHFMEISQQIKFTLLCLKAQYTNITKNHIFLLTQMSHYNCIGLVDK